MSPRTESGSTAAPVTAARRGLRPVARGFVAVALRTVATCVRYRVLGLGAEAAFFAILSLPPLIFGLVGAVGFITEKLDVRTIAGFRGQILALAARVLTRDAVNNVLAPTLDDVLTGGRFSIISIGFLIALWSGSRALNVFVDIVTIMYGMAGRRGILRTRALSFLLYVVFLVAGTILTPLVLAGPSFVDRLLPGRLEVLGDLYWPVVLVSSALALATLYHVAVPVRTRWRADLPGAGLTMLIWVGGSVLLRLVLGHTVGTTSIYGPLAAPIAVLVWLYLISVATLIGAAFNASLDELFPRLSGILRRETPDPVPAARARTFRTRFPVRRQRQRPPRSSSH